VLESDLRELFERQADSELLPTPISIPAARRIGRVRVLRRRAGAIGGPVVAVAAVVAVLLASPFAAPRQPAPGPGTPAAPKLFNPLVPYATAAWYPFRPSLVAGSYWHTGLLLRASSRSPARSTKVVLYAAGRCTLGQASLSCGSTASGTSVEMTVTGPAPDVQGQPAYWTRYAGGDLTPFRPQAGVTQRTLAFQYAVGGWAVVESTGTPADLLRVAASVRYGQASPLRFPFRLTGLPRAWSKVLRADYTQPGPGAQGPTEAALLLGSPATQPGTVVRDPLTVLASTHMTVAPRCQTKALDGPQAGHVGSPGPCPSSVIGGYRAYLNSPPVQGAQTLFVPDANGLYLYEQTISPGASLSPTAVLAHHLQLLGPDPANWTTTPVSP
jgi:hypothetical protein